MPKYEVIYFIAKSEFRLTPKANAAVDVWLFDQERDNPHPAPFPIALARRCVAASGDGVVLNLFLGSGTTALAARNEGQRWIGIDIDAAYCDMARRRLDAAAQQALPMPAARL